MEPPADHTGRHQRYRFRI